MQIKKGNLGNVELVSWRIILEESGRPEKELYFGDVHISDEGSILLWRVLVDKLARKGVTIEKTTGYTPTGGKELLFEMWKSGPLQELLFY